MGRIRTPRNDNVPAPVPDAVRDLAEAVRRLDDSLDDPHGEASVGEPARRAAARATLVFDQTGNLSVSAIVVRCARPRSISCGASVSRARRPNASSESPRARWHEPRRGDASARAPPPRRAIRPSAVARRKARELWRGLAVTRVVSYDGPSIVSAALGTRRSRFFVSPGSRGGTRRPRC